MDACIHPGLLEHLEDSLSDMEKRQILIDAMMECSSYEIIVENYHHRLFNDDI